MKSFCFFFSLSLSAELQKILNQKTAELANKTVELEERSAQPQRRKQGNPPGELCGSVIDCQQWFFFPPVLLIIQLQADIEKLSKTAKHDVDFEKIKGGFLLNRGYKWIVYRAATKEKTCLQRSKTA